METLMTLDDACRYLNVKRSRIYYLVFKNEIPHIKLGASLRFSPKKLNAWVQSQAFFPEQTTEQKEKSK